jgi:hypothetical protein
MDSVEGQTCNCGGTCVTCGDGTEEVSIKVEAINIKKEIPEDITFPTIKTEHEGHINLSTVAIAGSPVPEAYQEHSANPAGSPPPCQPAHKGGDRSAVQNYRPVSLTSVVCKHMEHVIAGYMRQVWQNSDWLYEGQHGFRPGYSCESQIITVCQDISDSLDEATRLDAIIIDFSKAFDRVPHDRLLKKIADSGVDPRVVVWIREFLVGRSQRVRVGGQLSDEVRVTSGVPQGSVLGPLLFLAYVNDIWRNIESKIRLFADDCIVYRKIVNNYDVDKLQTDLDRLGDWAVENEMKINPSKSKSISFTRARIKDPLNYTLRDQNIPEDSCCKYLGIIIRSDLSWADQVNHKVQKAWRALHFVMRVVKMGTKNTKSIAYKSLVRPILEYGAACWDPYRECQINTLDRVQNKAAKFAHRTGGSRVGIFGAA